ncbi:hypothetical protein [Desulfuromonas sp. TF]|uniref:hypothetical protein n=1 Tax=Desulfuromonas sp. TF TaxID=1232410 RepID=UPI000686126C|nr:hypothetical protein [Desulfuromonas sp. TF]
MNLTCPCCHAKYPLDAALEGEAAGELMVILAQAGPAARPLVAYLGLFRSKSRALSFDRAVKLAREVLDLDKDLRALGVALSETVEALRAKRDAGQVKPLGNHNYLKRVLESVTASPLPVPADPAGDDRQLPKGKRRLAIEILSAWAGDDWLRVEICHGLQALVSLPSLAPPGADSIELTAGVFETMIRPRCNIAEVDQGRVSSAFNELLKQPLKDWPEPSAVLAHLPRRPEREKVGHQVSDEDRRKGKDFFSKIQGGI